MRDWIPRLGFGFAVLAVVVIAEAGKPKVELLGGTSTLVREDGRLGRLAPPARFARASQHGSTIAADATGLWLVERNAGALIRTDHAGELVATFPLHAGLGELVLESGSGSLFVADRSADRLLRYATKGDEATLVAELSLTEPHGLALTPDGATLLVTSVANHELVAVAAATMQILWRVKLAAEPRAVAVSPEGRWALVGFLSTGAVARVELASAGERVSWHALSPRDPVEIEKDAEDDWGETFVEARVIEAPSRFEVPKDSGRRHARNVFALAFVGEGIAVAAHHVATPQMELHPDEDRRDSYGGGAAEIAPIEYRFARIAEPSDDGFTLIDQHHITVHQPRALAYDPARDMLYIGGYGDDEIVAVASASRERPTVAWRASLGEGPACGLDGLALIDQAPSTIENSSGATSLWAHCELARTVVRVDIDPDSLTAQPTKSKHWIRGPELAKSLRSAAVEQGAELFRRGESFALGSALACASCHPEGRNDGLSWRLGRSILQTPLLAGRLPKTSPYKWTGEDQTLRASFAHTIERIGGDPEELDEDEFAAIEAYLTSLPRPRPPSVNDEAALARGQTLFEDECSVCHEGPASTDRERHDFNTSMRRVDTPSLIGLAHSAPYYHDGSAVDLAAVLDDRGSIHDMIDSSSMSAAQRRDLIVYLQSL
ncbi:c-type cytochrome [Enhygromyxa salina]|uniref:c-type cytochrome n=1 Tax=Enhygromyxa salina TaxID=215803 RepID=UPI0015E6CDB0|nr:c-type cytochrome [Enhygromyxa salina]